MQGNAGQTVVSGIYASQSRIKAIAAGAAWTYRILRLTVTAP